MPSNPQNRAQQSRQGLQDQQDRLVAALRLARALIEKAQENPLFLIDWTRDMDDAMEIIDSVLEDVTGEEIE